MREIKFRIFGKENQIMYEWEEILNFDSLKDSLKNGSTEDNYYSPLMQYTGLLDKNGKEIYEGDIVENPFSIARDFCYQVIWYEENGQWCFDPFMKGDQDAPLLGIEEFVQNWETVQSGIEVIGNIYENPELINS